MDLSKNLWFFFFGDQSILDVLLGSEYSSGLSWILDFQPVNLIS